jgi:hypothetical protein
LIKRNRTGASVLGELPEVPETAIPVHGESDETRKDRENGNRRNRSHLEFIEGGDVTKNIRLHLKLGDAANALWNEMVTKTYDVFFQLAI